MANDLPWYIEQIAIPAAWSRVDGATPVRIAVHDAGIAVQHPAVASRIVPGWNFDHDSMDVRPSPVVDGGWTRDCRHGTSCAAVVCEVLGPNNIAAACRIAPIRLRRTAPLAHWVRSFKWAARHADILLCAWTMPTSDDLAAALIATITEGRGGKGLICIAAAGNRGGEVAFPGRIPGVVSVGASDEEDRLCLSSNAGSELELLAPGWTASGVGFEAVNLRLPGRSGRRFATGPDAFGGTSAAASIVAGVAALVLTITPSATAGEIRDILIQSAAPARTAPSDRRDLATEDWKRVNADRATALAVARVEADSHS